MDNSAKSKRIAKNTTHLFIRMLVVMCVGLFTSRIILSTLGVNDFGTYNVVGSIVVLFSFLQTALTNATYRFFTFDLGLNDAQKLNRTFSMSINAHLILSLIVIVLAETIGLWFLNYKLNIPNGRLSAANWAYHLSILTFCIKIIRTPYNSSIIAHERMSFFALTSIVEAVLKLFIVYVLVMGSFDKLILYTFLLLFVEVILLIWYWGYCIRIFPECHYSKYWDTNLLFKLVSYSGWSTVVNATDVGVTQAIVFFFNMFFGVVTNAALGIANQVNTYLIQFLQSFSQSFNPQIIKSYAEGSREYFIKLIFSTSKISFYMFFIVAFPIMLNSEFILKLWLGNVPENTSSFVCLILAYSLVDAYSAPLWTAVHATGNLKTHQLLMSSIKILNIPLAYLLLKMGYSAYWALAIKAILNFVCSVVRPIYMKKLINLHIKEYFFDVVLKVYGVAFLSLPLPIFLFKNINNDWNRLIITSVSSFVVIGLLIYFIGLNIAEQKLIRSFVKRN
jgi:O-antigen/teichoic acid export membrane protein